MAVRLPVKAWSRHKTETTEVEFDWCIEEFGLLGHQPGESIQSPLFFDLNKKAEWKLVVYPRGDSEASKDFVSAFLLLAACKKGHSIMAKYRLTALNSKEVQMSTTPYIPEEFTQYLSKGYNKFLSRKLLLESNELLLTDNLHIKCKVKYAVSRSSDGTAPHKPPVVPCDNKESLQGHFRELLTTKAHSDLTIDVKGKKFKAHKLILVARSPVFEAMFLSDLIEGSSNTLTIDDIEPDVFEELLSFLYTDYVKNLKPFAAELLAVADKYMLQGLKAKCGTSLARNIHVLNCCEMLLLADLHSALELKRYALEFIERHFVTVPRMKGWKTLLQNASPKLMLDMAGILMHLTPEERTHRSAPSSGEYS